MRSPAPSKRGGEHRCEDEVKPAFVRKSRAPCRLVVRCLVARFISGPSAPPASQGEIHRRGSRRRLRRGQSSWLMCKDGNENCESCSCTLGSKAAQNGSTGELTTRSVLDPTLQQYRTSQTITTEIWMEGTRSSRGREKIKIVNSNKPRPETRPAQPSIASQPASEIRQERRKKW